VVEWQPEDRDAWVVDAEKWISQIKGVLQCKVDLAPDGEISGVHVVARSDREPRHIVRDVEGLLKARLGISVFYKKIGVVQVVEAEQSVAPVQQELAASAGGIGVAAVHDTDLDADDLDLEQDEDDEGSAARDAILLAEELAPRLLCNSVAIQSTGNLLRAEVELQAAGMEGSGAAEGPNRSGGDLHLVAAATLDAVQNLLEESLELELVELRRERLGNGEILLVAVELVQGRRCEQLFGVCQPGPNTSQAVVYAVLDALNRRLEMMLFKAADEDD
jgi:hypothetical protein